MFQKQSPTRERPAHGSVLRDTRIYVMFLINCSLFTLPTANLTVRYKKITFDIIPFPFLARKAILVLCDLVDQA
jgi:hypothetical protein